MTLQLPLSVQLKQDVSFATFVPGSNRETLNALRGFVSGGNDRFIYVWGPQGIGKTHLLQAACRQAQALGQAVAYLPLSGVDELDTGLLEDIDRFELNCLDDIQCICDRPDWEHAIFNLFNRLRENGGKMLIGADVSPSRLPVALPDLKSRLAWGPAYRIQALNDEDRLLLLIQSAKRRGLELSRDTGWYLLRRCPRDNPFLQRLLDYLDRYSLATQRRLTIPLVREALGNMSAPEVQRSPGPVRE